MRGLPFFKAKNKPQFAGLNFSNDSSGGGGSYTLPTATASRLGGVKIGSGINVEEDGTISASGGGGGGVSVRHIPLNQVSNTIELESGKSYLLVAITSGGCKLASIVGGGEYDNLIGSSSYTIDRVTTTSVVVSTTSYSIGSDLLLIG